jgi:hypothetical protein
MSSKPREPLIDDARARRCLCGTLRSLVILLAVVLSFPLAAAESPQSRQTEVWLVTYGPGEIYWQRFGHNAIWVRDVGLGLDHVFNFGFFDFQQENFFLRFLQGRMQYFSAAREARVEFADYINENRSIRAQRLDLSEQQKLGLIEYLLEEVTPQNRDYLYDYYVNNCSTRVRDAIDLAMDGLLKREFQPFDATLTWRDQTRRLTAEDFWLYLGLEIGLGSPTDRVISRWDEMFIPADFADALASVTYSGGEFTRPLVLEDVVLYQSSLEPPPASPMAWWPGYLLASLGLVFSAWLLCHFLPWPLARGISRAWLVVSGAVGLVLLFLWLGTDHWASGLNVNLLVFFPVLMFLPFWKGREKISLLLVSGLSLLALAMIFLPPHQYNLDVLAAFLPLNLAAALGLFRSRTSLAMQPGVPATVDR